MSCPSTGKPRSRLTAINSESRPPQPKNEDTPEIRPPSAKRVRKAVNCEPCRHSKLKCDRNRPCSSCVLRGTTSMCYQGFNGQPLTPNPEDKGVDPIKEFARIRHSLSILETRYFPDVRNRKENLSQTRLATPLPKKEDDDTLGIPDPETNAPGMLGMHRQSGFYTGPTSAASHLVMDDAPHSPEQRQSAVLGHDYDSDLIELLPPMHVIDALIDYYFEYCNWIYRHVDQATFLPAWQRYKDGLYPDRLTLATACVLVSLAIQYLPAGHELLSRLPVSPFEPVYLELSLQYYTTARTALRRHQDETKAYNLELVELLLARGHYLTYSKTDTEEIWSVTGELMTIGTAMGLHRDPGQSKFSVAVAERRRWAWWHIYLLESWQAFMFGRPMALASHHFNTQFPTYCDPAIDPTGKLFLPNIALFRLSSILGEIMDDAVSFRPVSYESTLAKDRLLTEWLSSLPSDIDLDEYHMVRSLSSSDISVRRFGVQSIVLLSSHYHMRFTLHRSHVGPTQDSSTAPQSLDIAVNAAEKLISLAAQMSPEFVPLDTGMTPDTLLHIHGHLNWRPFHVFSAAIFFTFQLIRSPDQPRANLLRSCVRKSLQILNSERSYNVSVAEKSLKVLLTLAPLYSEEYLALDAQGRENEKARILSIVNTLAFPYQEPPLGRVGLLSSVATAAHTGTSVAGGSSNCGLYIHDSSSSHPVQDEVPSVGNGLYTASSSMSLSVSNMRACPGPAALTSSFPPRYAPESGGPSQTQQPYPFGLTPTTNITDIHVPATNDWGGAVGFGQDEWLGFMDNLQRPGTSS